MDYNGMKLVREINRTIDNADIVFKRVYDFYKHKANVIEDIDGISMEFDNWRFNLRKSNTEPLVRLNVESRGDYGLMHSKTREILNLIT